MKVKHELTKKYELFSWMKFFEWTKSLRNILWRLKSDVHMFRGIIYW